MLLKPPWLSINDLIRDQSQEAGYCINRYFYCDSGSKWSWWYLCPLSSAEVGWSLHLLSVWYRLWTWNNLAGALVSPSHPGATETSDQLHNNLPTAAASLTLMGKCSSKLLERTPHTSMCTHTHTHVHIWITGVCEATWDVITLKGMDLFKPVM